MTTAELALEPVAPSSGAARRWVGERLAALGLHELADTVTLLTSEVVTNAVLHAATPLRVALRPEGKGVQVEVHDASDAPPSRRRHPTTSTVGRGLAMLDSLADEWGWRRDGAGKVVWFRVEQARDAWPDPVGLDPDLSGDDLSGLLEKDGPDPDESGLGRYARDDAAGAAPGVRITLRGLPLRLLVASQEHHDGLLRELRLLALSDQGDEADRDPRLRALVDALGRQYAPARARRDEEVDAALARGETTIDQEFSVPAAAADAMRAVAALLADADRLGEANLLMTPVRGPLLRRFAEWYTAEVVAQTAGEAPRPWDGPLDPTS